MAFLIPFDSRPYGGTDGELDDQPDERLDGRVLCQVAADLAYRAAACRPGRTTGELASLVGVSAASASQHAAVLRKAGLITTVRDGGRVLHTLAPTGVALLEGRPLPPETQDPYG